MNFRLFFILMLVSGIATAQPAYKIMMNDLNVNFYDVVKEAEQYFQTHPRGQGSGWKGYQRWKAENESKYYPSGDRANADHRIAEKAYQNFVNQNITESTAFDNGWRDLGPYAANNITTGYNSGIGRVECLWVNPANDQHIYMGSRSGGFWRTTDGGNTWQNTTDFLVASGVNTMAVNPNNPDSILINVQNGGNSTSHGIYRSTDGGLTWNPTNFIPSNLSWGGLGTNDRIFKIAYHPTITGLVFVGTSQGFYRSTNDLATSSIVLNPSEVTDIEFHPTNPNIVYAYDDYFFGSNQDVVMISTNQGVSFNQGGTLSGNSGATGFLATSPACPNCVYVGSSNGIWKSTNSATSFSFVNNPSQSCRGFAVSDLNDNNILYGYVDLEASTNGGATFNQVSWWYNLSPDGTYVHADLRAAECVNGVFYVGTDGYLAKSTNNGTSWTRLNEGTNIRENYAVGISQSNRAVHMSGSQDNGTSILNDNGWIEWNGGDGMEAVIQTLNEDWMIGSWQYGTRQRTQDGGQTRQSIGTPQSGSSQAYWVSPLLYDYNDQMTIYHFSDSVFKSDEFGGN
ncbi:MAG: hypothetical protein KDD99_28030, partial [Bacteroidetes bacterium]|nr:hypothetical protein [Bacteroidota bacterium]